MKKLVNNPLKTRGDLKQAVLDICAPLLPLYSEGKSRLHVGDTSACYSDSTAEVEAFSRVLWGLAPMFTDGSGDDWAELYRKGLSAGTDPENPEYWGDVHDCDQLLVEMAAMGLALILAPEKIWEPLSDREKDNLYNWLNFVNTKKAWDCNWRLFAVMVNLGFRKVGRPYNKDVVEAALNRVDEFYLGDGWYADGVNAHSDYYVPFAIYFYQLIYAKEMENEDPERSALFKERAKEFAEDFIYFFSDDGSAVPYGRSMTYRFAQAAFWSAYAYAGVDGFEDGVVKGIILRHLRSWFKRPIWNNDGTLSIGYGYPNLIMTEGYNAPGSPYWAMKTMLILALPEDSNFWQCEELPLPKSENSRALPHPHMIAQRDGEHRVLFAAGHPYTNCHTHCGAKYEKFAYSNLFGFSAPKSEWGTGAGGFDNTLALSECDNVFRVKRKNDEFKVTDKYIYTKWSPWKDVEIKTYIIPSLPWHVRVHIIDSARELDSFEGGFSYPCEHVTATKKIEGGEFASFDGYTSGIVSLAGGRGAWLQGMEANTNLIYSRTSMPALGGKIPAGKTILACGVFCGKDGE
ncbi:MAG: DUF2264 domain-containing protein [Clostridia bacterium]